MAIMITTPPTIMTTTPTTTTPTLFFARMGITYESWRKMKAIHLKLITHGRKFWARTGSTFFQRFGITRDSWRKFTLIKKRMNANARKVYSGEIQVVKPGARDLELLGNWSSNRKTKKKI